MTETSIVRLKFQAETTPDGGKRKALLSCACSSLIVEASFLPTTSPTVLPSNHIQLYFLLSFYCPALYKPSETRGRKKRHMNQTEILLGSLDASLMLTYSPASIRVIPVAHGDVSPAHVPGCLRVWPPAPQGWWQTSTSQAGMTVSHGWRNASWGPGDSLPLSLWNHPITEWASSLSLTDSQPQQPRYTPSHSSSC